MIGFQEDMKVVINQQKPTISNKKQQSQSEQKREMIMIQYFWGQRQANIAKSLGVSRQYVHKLKRDYEILDYVLRGQLETWKIASILDIGEKTVVDVIHRYHNFILNYGY